MQLQLKPLGLTAPTTACIKTIEQPTSYQSASSGDTLHLSTQFGGKETKAHGYKISNSSDSFTNNQTCSVR